MAALRARGRVSILFTLAVLVAASGARADVLVPSDPPAPRAPGPVSCIAAVGEALAYQHEVGARNGADRAPTVAQLDPGPLQSITLGRPVRIDYCPTAAGAADGTAAVGFLSIPGGILSSAPRIVVRLPGGAFGAPLGLTEAAPDGPDTLTAPAVAAAPGGWVAAAWVQRTDQTQLAVAVIAPDGTMRTTVLDTGPLFETGFSWPRVGIDANGVATVAWTRWTLVDEDRPTLEHVFLARSAPGAASWEPKRDLAVGGRGSSDEASDGRVGLAVTAGGRVLAAWSNGLAVRAVEGDESGLGAPTTLASIAGAGVPSVGLSEDGAAVVAFSQFDPADDERTQVFAVQRAAGGAWTAAQRLSGPPIDAGAAPREGRPIAGDGGPGDVLLATALAPDGRELVAWAAEDAASLAERVVAVTGRAGLPWAPVRMLSIPTRQSHGAPAATLDASGDPRVVWVEESPARRARVHADRLESDAQAPPPDTSAPRLTVTLPRAVRLDRRGVRALRLTVRCSEACDLRAAVRIPGDAVPEASGLRALAAGAPTVVTIRQIGTEDFLRDIKPRHMRLDVLGADRAGNVTVRTRLLAVRRP